MHLRNEFNREGLLQIVEVGGGNGEGKRGANGGAMVGEWWGNGEGKGGGRMGEFIWLFWYK